MNRFEPSERDAIMRKLVVLFALIVFASAAHAQPVNPHAAEPIGTVRQVYDGALPPDIQVNTFRNIDRLFPTRTVARGNPAISSSTPPGFWLICTSSMRRRSEAGSV